MSFTYKPLYLPHINAATMETAVQRTPMTLNLRSDLVNTLSKEALKESLSLDALVEDILMGVSFDRPNKETTEAIEELKAGKYAGELDVSNCSMFIKSLNSIE